MPITSATGHVTARSVGISIDNGASVLGTGLKGYVICPYAGTISGWNIVGAQSGSITFDVWKKNAAIPTITDTITASAKPLLSSAQNAVSTAVSTWTTAVAAGDIFAFNVDSVTTITKATLIITINT